MKYLNIDLLGYRCPDVAQKMLQALRMLVESEESLAIITTVEPSARRDLATAIELHYSGKLELKETINTELTSSRKTEILNAKEGFDEEDLTGIKNELKMLIAKRQ